LPPVTSKDGRDWPGSFAGKSSITEGVHCQVG
jgi:hypothetical protein